MGSKDLLWRQAAALTRTANARTENEDGLSRDNRRYQVSDEFHRIAAIAVEKDQDFRVLAHRGYPGLDGASVAASRLNNDAGPNRGCLGGRSVLRAAVHDENFADILGKHGGYDPRNCRFLV